VLLSAMSATTTQLLSSGEFCKLLNDTIHLQSAFIKVSFYTNNSKFQILSCDTLVTNERKCSVLGPFYTSAQTAAFETLAVKRFYV
jgi:hypothetical protein